MPCLDWHWVVLIRNHRCWLLKARSWNGLSSVLITWRGTPRAPGPLQPILCSWYVSFPHLRDSPLGLFSFSSCALFLSESSTPRTTTAHVQMVSRFLVFPFPGTKSATLHWASPISPISLGIPKAPKCSFLLKPCPPYPELPLSQDAPSFMKSPGQKPRSDLYPPLHPLLSPTFS